MAAAIMKKFSPKIRLMEGRRPRVHPCCINLINVNDRSGYLNNDEAINACDLEKLLKDGSKATKSKMDEWREGRQDELDRRWNNWVLSSHELWKKKNEVEQRMYLDMRWAYLKDLLHRQGIDTSNHRLLLSMEIIEPVFKSESENGGGILEFKIGSPDRGLVSMNRLVLDRGCYMRRHLESLLPRQTVSGLLCFQTNRYNAFFVYNPITGERSPWIETRKTKYSCIDFGFNPQSGEHKVIWISSNKPCSNQVVEVYDVGRNTWRRIDTVPPMALPFDEGFERPLYVDGCLYWQFSVRMGNGKLEIIMMRFDIVTEKFQVIPIPDFVINPNKWHLHFELTEVDGLIAVLQVRCVEEHEISLWTFHEDADGSIEWTQEVIDVPHPWNGNRDNLEFQALTGTNLIFLRSSDSIFYYNRNTKESIRFPISPHCVPGDWEFERVIQV